MSRFFILLILRCSDFEISFGDTDRTNLKIPQSQHQQSYAF